MQAFFDEFAMFKRLLIICLLLFANISLADTATDTETQRRLQNIFQNGMNAFNQGDYQEAIVHFRQMLKDHPNLLRPRLELARSLYKSGDYRSAKYHFEQVLPSTILPAVVRKNVNDFLVRIRQYLPSFNLSLDVSLNEKVPKREFIFNGIPFVFDNTDIRQHSYDLVVSGKIPIIPEKRIFTKLRVEYSDISGSDNATTYLRATLGKHYQLSKAATITPELGFHHLIYYNHQLYNGAVFSLRYFKPISRADYLNITYNHQRLDYVKRYQARRGAKNELSFAFTKLPSSSSRFDAQLRLSTTNAKEQYNASKGLGVNLAYNQDISNAWNVGISFRESRTYYQEPSPRSGGIKQREKQTTVELSILNRLWSINNIAPKLSIGKTRNRSNIDVYGKSEPYIKLGFTQQF